MKCIYTKSEFTCLRVQFYSSANCSLQNALPSVERELKSHFQIGTHNNAVQHTV